MNAKATGGPAYPHSQALDFSTNRFVAPSTGMTMRDAFALKALPSVYERLSGSSFDTVARIAYDLADAMLAERSKR